MSNDVKTVSIFDWLENQMNTPEGRKNAEEFILSNYRANANAANDKTEVELILDRLNDLFFRADDENKIAAIGTEAKAEKKRRIALLEKELSEYKKQLSEWVDRELK